jgi:hypothetical protein
MARRRNAEKEQGRAKGRSSEMDAILLRYRLTADSELLESRLPKQVAGQLDVRSSVDLKILVTATHLVAEVPRYTTITDLRSGGALVLDGKERTYQASRRCPREAGESEWETCSAGTPPRRVVLRGDGIRLEVEVADLSLPARAVARLWQLLVPQAPGALTEMGAPRRVEVYGSGQDPVLVAELVESGRGRAPDTTPPEGYRPVEARPVEPRPAPPMKSQKKGNPADQPYTPPAPVTGGPPRLAEAVRVMRDRHELRPHGQDTAWVLRQPVLDDIRAVANTLSRRMERFQDAGNGSVSLVLDLWPPLRAALEGADYDQVPGFGSWQALRQQLMLCVIFLRLMEGQAPVQWNQEPGGMRPEESFRLLDWARRAFESGTFDPNLLVTFVHDVFNNNSTRASEVGEAQLAHTLRVTVPDEADRITEFSGRLPLTDPEWQLIGYRIHNFNVVLAIDGQPLVDRLEYDTDRVLLDVRLHALSVGLDWSSWALASPLSVALSFITGGGWAIWLDNNGHWSAALSARVHFDIIPEHVGTGANRAIQVGVEFNADHSEFGWTADALITENPINAPVLWLFALIAERITDWSGELNGHIARPIAGKLDELLRAALRWPDVWLAAEGPLTFGSAALFEPDNGIWEGSLVSRGYLVPSGIATSVEPELAEPVAIVVSDRYLNGWLQERLRRRFGRFPFQTGLDAYALARLLGAALPPPEELEAEAPEGEPLSDLFSNRSSVRCPEPPTPPAPETEYLAMLTRTEPRVWLPRGESADHVGRFVVEYAVQIAAVRTWQVPVIVSQGYDCVPVEVPDPRLNPEVLPRLDLNFSREMIAFPQPGGGLGMPKVSHIAAGQNFSFPFATGSGSSALPLHPGGGGQFPVTGGFPAPGGSPIGTPGGPFPSPGISGPGLPDRPTLPGQTSRFCFIECGWAYQTRRRGIATLLQISGSVSGNLVMDFDSSAYGEEGRGFFTGPLPGIRLTVPRRPDGSPDLTVTARSPTLGGPLEGLDPERVRDYFTGRFAADGSNLFRGLTVAEAPRLRHTMLPRSAQIEAILDARIRNLYDFIRGLLVYQQAPQTETPNYLIRSNLVYWPLELRQNVTEWLNG